MTRRKTVAPSILAKILVTALVKNALAIDRSLEDTFQLNTKKLVNLTYFKPFKWYLVKRL